MSSKKDKRWMHINIQFDDFTEVTISREEIEKLYSIKEVIDALVSVKQWSEKLEAVLK